MTCSRKNYERIGATTWAFDVVNGAGKQLSVHKVQRGEWRVVRTSYKFLPGALERKDRVLAVAASQEKAFRKAQRLLGCRR